ncbi:Neurogenic locus notch-like protein, partial [Thalictrum thalictroides]
TLNTSCTKAQAPSPQVEDPPKNSSFFDPCKWAYCGEGSCMKESKFGHKCECQEGYANLLNTTVFPCLSECSLGMDCANLGLSLPNRTTGSTSVSTDKSDNHASSILPGNILLLVTLMLTIGMILSK